MSANVHTGSLLANLDHGHGRTSAPRQPTLQAETSGCAHLPIVAIIPSRYPKADQCLDQRKQTSAVRKATHPQICRTKHNAIEIFRPWSAPTDTRPRQLDHPCASPPRPFDTNLRTVRRGKKILYVKRYWAGTPRWKLCPNSTGTNMTRQMPTATMPLTTALSYVS